MAQIILMPGMEGTGEMFAPLLLALGDSLPTKVLRYPPDVPLSYEELLPRVRAELPQGEPFVLLGESFSGPLAIMLAAERPAGLRGVIFSASFAQSPLWWLPRFARHVVRPWLFRWRPRPLLVKIMLGRYATPELRQLLWNAQAQVHAEVLSARAGTILAVDVVEQLKACTVPIMYLRGESDWVVPGRTLRSLLRHKPSIEVATLPAPHLVLQVAPEEAAQAIRSFVAACARDGDT